MEVPLARQQSADTFSATGAPVAVPPGCHSTVCSQVLVLHVQTSHTCWAAANTCCHPLRYKACTHLAALASLCLHALKSENSCMGFMRCGSMAYAVPPRDLALMHSVHG